MRRRFLPAIAVLGMSSLVFTACTVTPSERDGASPDIADAQGDPAPVVTVANEVIGDDANAGADSAATSPGDADEADEPVSGDPASEVTIAAGERLSLDVEGGEFTQVELLDLDHETVPADAGGFDAETDDASESDDASEVEAETDDAAAAMAGGGVSGSDEPTDEPARDGPTDEPATEAQGTEWISSADLVTGARYQWTATTVSPDGNAHTSSGVVTTPETTAVEELTANTVISDGETVGVGAPIVVMFNSTIPEEVRDDIESRLSVDVTDEDGEPVEVEGSWGWLYDTDGVSRVHYRPEEFWPANVDIEVNLPLEGVEYSDRWYGKEDVSFEFEVGRDQRVTADAQTHRMKIERDGEEIVDWPTSLGSPQAPSYNGMHVVMSKHEHYVMTSEQWNYETPTNWAVRIHNNGEFIHGAPWSAGSQGSANVSHGCINLTDERAKEYFDMALYGDPVEITGSSVDLSTEHSDISDWVYEWDEWQELSALD